jgi:hypothetical protein
MSEGKRMIKTENAPLNIGDMVVCKSMSDTIEGPSSEKKVKGTPGKVEKVYTVFGLKQYQVKWKVGPTLDLIDGKFCKICKVEYQSDLDFCENKNCSSVESGNPEKLKWIDEWWKIEWVDNQVTERYILKSKKRFLMEADQNGPAQKFVDLSKFYDVGKISKFFELLRRSGIVNMMMSPQYLYLGRERIEHEHKYTDIFDDFEEYYDMMLDMADDVKRVMVLGAEKQMKDDKSDDSEMSDEEYDEYNSRYFRNMTQIIKRDSMELFKLWTNIKGGSKKMK